MNGANPERIEELKERALGIADRHINAEPDRLHLRGIVVEFAAALLEERAANAQLREAVENWYEDVDELLGQDLRLHDLQQRIGALFLGYGGGYNHVEDLRAALAVSPPADKASG